MVSTTQPLYGEFSFHFTLQPSRVNLQIRAISYIASTVDLLRLFRSFSFV